MKDVTITAIGRSLRISPLRPLSPLRNPIKGTKSIDLQLDKLCFGTTMIFLTQSILKKLLFPFPPLAEQQAIVKKVDRLMAMIDELEKQVTERKYQAELLTQSVLREAFAA